MNIFSRYLHGRSKKKFIAPLRKGLFYGITITLGWLILSKKINSSLYYLVQDNETNKKIIQRNKYLLEGKYSPTAYLILSSFQNLYFKYFSTKQYIKHTIKQTQNSTIIYVPISNQCSKMNKKQVPTIIVVSGSGGFDHNLSECLLRIHDNKCRAIGVVPKDYDDFGKFIKDIKLIKSQDTEGEYYGLGMEYGANLMVNAAATDQSLFSGIVSLANPLQLTLAEKKLQNSWLASKIYLKDIIKGLQQNNQQKVSTLRQIHLKKNPEAEPQKIMNYYSSLYRISNLKIPALFMQAKTDQLCISLQQQILPEEYLQNPQCIYVETLFGGHNLWYQCLVPNNWAFFVSIEHLRIIHELRLKKIINKI